MRIQGLTATTIIMCALNLVDFFVLVGWNSPSAIGQAAFYGLITAAVFIVLWFYWNQKNWARILVMLCALISLTNVMYLEEFGLGAQILILVEFPFGIFMLWWLNTRAVKVAFQTRLNR
jgi:hypothetical protein